MYSSMNDFPEDGLQRPKHVVGASQNNEYLLPRVQSVALNTVQSVYCTEYG